MLDFFEVEVKRDDKKKSLTLYPSFKVYDFDDLMIKGHSFYAVWDEENNEWSTSEQRACDIIDKYIDDKERELKKETKYEDYSIYKMGLSRYKSKQYSEWRSYCSSIPDYYHELDSKIIFADETTTREDYCSKHLPYVMKEGSIDSYDELMSTLYAPEERDKIEWALGSVIAGDSKSIQKFVVFYGEPGSGKSTVIKIINMLFQGYTKAFDAKAIGSASASFSLEPFKDNPLIAYQDDGDLSKIEDNTRLNTIVSHEKLVVNEKHKSTYAMKFNTMLFIGTNEPVKITNSRSGIIRRLLDIKPTGDLLSSSRYDAVMAMIPFELGAIAYHCYHKYLSMGKNYYIMYKPIAMLSLTNEFYNFIDDNIDFFIENSEWITLNKIWDRYKKYCEEVDIVNRLPLRIVKREAMSYYESFKDRWTGYRKVYFGFITDKFNYAFQKEHEDEKPYALCFDETESLIDKLYSDLPAQYANLDGNPIAKWANVKTKLKDLDTTKLHYLFFPEDYKNHIVIDFDIKDENGNKSFEKNLEAASKWPPTYAELSKSGAGIHLHYVYEGNVDELSRIYAEDIEVKIFNGNSSLRRMLTRCNNVPIAHISSGLPLKGDKKMVNLDAIESEVQLRKFIKNCLEKKHHGHTAPEVNYIYSELEKCYNSGMHYDVRDLRGKITQFANSSNNQSFKCLELVSKMKFHSEDVSEPVEDNEAPLCFFDFEIFPNLFVACWMFDDGDKVYSEINPTGEKMEELMKYNLVGFNCRRYDNHIMYARKIGYNNQELYELSQKIVNGKKGDNSAMFREAYNISYTDVYDFASEKQSLKKWEIDLGLPHRENDYPWDKPVPEDKWEEIVEYCKNDVRATKAVFHHLSADFNARKILAELTGLTPNATNLQIITKMIIGNDKNPPLNYPDLSELFPGYEFVQDDSGKWHNMYRGTDVGFGGYVFAKPGMYPNVALLDVNNMHGASIDLEDKFGPYTQNYRDLRAARIAIKHREYDRLKDMFDGKFMKYVQTDEDAENLQKALKLVLNSTYGIAAATFDNPLKDPRDKNNVIALRGALFMRTLQDEVTARGYDVVHIKTDSIKVPNATPEIISFIQEFAQKYGYEMEHEATYSKMCLVNDAVYIAKYDKEGIRNKGGKHANEWTATGAEFQAPYIFKTLFSHEPLEFKDFCETRSVQKGALYLDFNEKLPDDTQLVKERDKLLKNMEKEEIRDATEQLEDYDNAIAACHDYRFVGKVGQFTPVLPGCGGGLLYRMQDNKYYAAAGTKGYRWLESELVKEGQLEDKIDMSYFDTMANEAIKHISEFGDYEWFTSDDDMSWMEVTDGPEEVEFTAMNKPQ